MKTSETCWITAKLHSWLAPPVASRTTFILDWKKLGLLRIVGVLSALLAFFGTAVPLHAANAAGECYVTVNVTSGTLPAGWTYQLQYLDTDSNWYNGASGNSTQTYYKQQGDWSNRSIQWRCQLKFNNSNYGTPQTNTCFAGSDSVAFTVTAPAVATPPSITSHPVSVTVPEGGSATFTVSASGTAPLSYQWRKNGADIPGAVGTSFTINPVTAADVANYACFVSNTAGNVTSNVASLALEAALDTDQDGLPDSVETGSGTFISISDTGTSPTNPDTDGDGVSDGVEVFDGTDPTESGEFSGFSSGLLAFWPFDGDARDFSGNGHHGTVEMAELAPDRTGVGSSAYAFNGTSSRIRVNSSIVGGADTTISFWLKCPAAAPSQLMEYIARDSWALGYFHGHFSVDFFGGTVGGDSPQGFEFDFADYPQWQADEWFSYTFVRDSSSLKYRYYINGQLVGEQDQAALYPTCRFTPGFIGAWSGFSGLERFLKGSLDDMRIYSRALSSSEVASMYVSEQPGLKVTSDPQLDNGTIEGIGVFPVGSEVSLTAVPDEGYVFDSWTGDLAGSENPATLTMDSDKTVGAVFVPDTGDNDLDGLSNYQELVLFGTDPDLEDTDDDGLSDAHELGLDRFSIVDGFFRWEEARQDAEGRGGTLATFTNEGEWARVVSFLDDGALDLYTGLWLGATDAEEEGVWSWVTGEAFDYANWAPGEPDNVSDADALEVSGGFGATPGLWRDTPAAALRDGYLLETGYSTDPTVADSDGDGLDDGDEIAAGSSPVNQDSDGDGLLDGDEVHRTSTDPTEADSDGDGTNDADDDEDGDGLGNLAELSEHGTDPLLADTDGDGVDDGDELSSLLRLHELVSGAFNYAQAEEDAAAKRGRVASLPTLEIYNRAVMRARQIEDGDLWIGLSDLEAEGAWKWTDQSALAYDAWADGQPDGGTVENHVAVAAAGSRMADADGAYVAAGYIFERVGLDPLNNDTDGDGLTDGEELNSIGSNPADNDTDGDGLNDGDEVNVHGSSPTATDSDGDGLNDRIEVVVHGTNPALADSDSDGFDDLFELNTGFDPNSETSTPDALSTIRTAVEFRFNAAEGVSYRIENSTDLETWNTVETDIIGQGGVVTRFYSTENRPKRYFRVRRN